MLNGIFYIILSFKLSYFVLYSLYFLNRMNELGLAIDEYLVENNLLNDMIIYYINFIISKI